jgi:hypothetical protein
MALRAALARTRLGTSIVRAPISKPAPLRAGTQRYYSAGAQQPNSGKPSFAAMAAVASLGFAAYYTLVKSREGQRTYQNQSYEMQYFPQSVILNSLCDHEHISFA